jgi:hypothetical protein
VPLLSSFERHMMTLANQYTDDCTQRATYKRASAHGENRVDAGGGIGIEFHVVELG